MMTKNGETRDTKHEAKQIYLYDISNALVWCPRGDNGVMVVEKTFTLSFCGFAPVYL